MTDQPDLRRLATILSIDIAGFSRAKEIDDIGSSHHLRDLRRLASDRARMHRGRIFSTAGDRLMLEFDTIAGGVATALDIAEGAAAMDDMPGIRLGLHVGDVTMLANGDLVGAGVNVAALVQHMAQPGEILASGDVQSILDDPGLAQFSARPPAQLDTMSRQVQVFLLTRPGAATPSSGLVDRIWRFARPAAMVAGFCLSIAAAGGLMFLSSRPQPQSAGSQYRTGIPVVIVTPFRNMSGEPGFRYFTDGVTEEIQHALSRIRGIRVIARDSGFAAIETMPDAADAARSVNATHILSGSVRRNAESLRVTAQLVLGQTGEIVWTQSFERPMSETLLVQDEIATRVAHALSIVAPESARAPSIDPRAFELYLKGRDAWGSGGSENGPPELAIASLEEAVELAPGFARAWAALASAYAQRQNWLLADEQEAVIEKAMEAARKALELDPAMGEPYIVLGRFDPSQDWSTRATWFARALETDPNDSDVQMLTAALWLSQTGQMQRALRQLRNAYEADPLSPLVINDYAGALVATGDIAGLEKLVNERVRQQPELASLWQIIFSERLLRADFAGARLALAKIEAFFSTIAHEATPEKLADASALLEEVLVAMETRDPMKLDSLVQRFKSDATKGQASAVLAMHNLALIGRYDDAFEVADELFLRDGYRINKAEGKEYVPYRYAYGRAPTAYLLGHSVAPLQRDPRIWRIFAATGLAKYWRDSRIWPDFCARTDLGYDCKTAAADAIAAQKMN
jgi:TolB-like protein/class 3 adenylate cyclase